MEHAAKEQQQGAYQALENMRLRLLDLTARNRLINFTHTKNGSLRIIDELPNQLVGKLLSDEEMRFNPIPEPKEQELIASGYLEQDKTTGALKRLRNDPTAKEWAQHLGFATSYQVPEPSATSDAGHRHQDNAIQTLLFPYELEARLKALSQASDSAIQEMGANILYLAFGFLEWYESNQGGTARIAPLFLVPVRLEKGHLNRTTQTYEYSLSYSGEEIIPNLSLREKLRSNFAMALPELDENTDPESYFSDVQALIEDNQPRWRIQRYISLTLLNFNKLLMYLDLDPSRWPKDKNIANHPVVSRFLDGLSQTEAEQKINSLGFGEEYLIDEIKDIHTHYPLINDADSSQHSALIDAIDGKNLVIEGPPGTGKSQTITNLIAAAMAQGKKVLFVAEKLAALEVVHSRLTDAGLGDFCLELHSHKSQKRKILDTIKTRLNSYGNYRSANEIALEVARYEELKNTLKTHAEKINQYWGKTGLTLHSIFTKATRYRLETQVDPLPYHPEGYTGDNYDPITQRRHEEILYAYQRVYRAVVEQLAPNTTLQEHPWYGTGNNNLQSFELDKVTQALNDWQLALEALQDQQALLANTLSPELAASLNTVASLQALTADLSLIPPTQGDELFELLPRLKDDALLKAKAAVQLFNEIQTLRTELTQSMNQETLQQLIANANLVSASEYLRNTVKAPVTLGQLATALHGLGTIYKQLEQLKEPFNGLLQALGESAPQQLRFSIHGLLEFKRVIQLIASLAPQYWPLRSELFDSDLLDSLLPQLRQDIQEITNLQHKLSRTFNLAKTPSSETIQQLELLLASGGTFSWLNSSWRKGKKQLLSYAAAPKTKLKTMLPLLPELAVYAKKLSAFATNAHYPAALGSYFQQLETDLEQIEALRSWYRHVRQAYGIGFGPKVALGNAILGLPASIATAVRSLVERDLPNQLDSLLDNLDKISCYFSASSRLAQADALLVGEEGAISQLVRNVHKALNSCKALTDNDETSIVELAKQIKCIQTLGLKLDEWHQLDCNRTIFYGQTALDPNTDQINPQQLAAVQRTLQLAECLTQQLKNPLLVQAIYQHPTEASLCFLADYQHTLRAALEHEQLSYQSYSQPVTLDGPAWQAACGDTLSALIQRNQSALDNPQALNSWLAYSLHKEQLQALGLSVIAESIEQQKAQIEQADKLYKAGIFDYLAREILTQDPQLARFSGHTQEAIQDKFREYDNKLKQLQCEQIAWRIDQSPVPVGISATRASLRTEKALLEHECNLKRPRTSMRQLLHRAGNAIAALKPCFMMGPMSVAQYLTPGKLEFDLVVMDEASQIKPQDALGAIARGGQLVVVGDPKQLPPTSFFDRVIDEDEDDPTGLEESESILDATLTMFPARRLRWHYRSQHESLIAFSNYAFYDNDLVLFPSPYQQAKGYGIQYTRLASGCFVNRCNLVEAQAIAEAVRQHLMHTPEETLGVVAMSAEQRLQIERHIETLAKEDALFQSALEKNDSQRERLFVKNLENVQGDERDVIFISMTYGPQEAGGKVYQRFGPINSDVGWRRLNVLFTRSKKRMQIFSSMGSNDIIVSPNSKRGVIALRDFLSYCETGLIHSIQDHTGKTPDSDFEIAVMQALQQEGFSCRPQVGVSGYFIDLAVIDPGNPGRYLMGIECDGATYHSAKSARDRDRLRQAHLERLDWRIRRIWSTDWFKNPKGELAPIIRELHELKTPPSLNPEPAALTARTEPDTVLTSELSTSVAEALSSVTATAGNLEEQLREFEREVIRKECPNTEENKRLLRPTMLETLLEYRPVSTAEFLEVVPAFIRQGTDAAEGKYLSQVFEIINNSYAHHQPDESS